MRILFIAGIAIVVLVCGSCFEKGDCIINNTNLIKIDFKKRTSTKKDTAITFKSIEVEGTSIVLYKDSVDMASVQLPVDPAQNETTFLFNYGEIQQKIKFTYRNQTIIPSADCGAFIYQDQVTIAESSFDPALIKIVNTELLKNAEVNFEILF